ncbi:YicC family protein [Siculibacillus lacustris]|uniref:YicC family protein n=1 Tax=Siculibacillus lacustris TaxID=1549641 RepID=A0A4Q9VUN3_9HYPH|nr:YicC/YloC family endoribonuclease [Siculibacillus lacustris]TBW39776.1 YicC family protein [Siculibacillus lacustris]
MTLCSMTGFARYDGGAHGQRWTWELRSVNGKGLDVRLRLPPGYDRLEAPTRERATGRLVRGNLQVSLTLTREAATSTLRVNEEVLAAVLAAMNLVADRIDATAPTLDGILGIKGVLETVDVQEDAATREAIDAAILADLDRALADLVAARAREGEAIGRILSAQIDTVERLTLAAEACPARTPQAIRARLADQVAALVEASSTLDPQRLHQEAVLLATRADIREELDRLTTHVAEARRLLAQGTAVGRRLDFLAQEFNRETNTLCSKSNDRELTTIGLEMKATVDQLREQIQNIE